MSQDDVGLEALLEFLNAAEAGIVAAKHVISGAKGIEKWDPSKIKFEETQGTKGPYERANPQATHDFKAMLADLKAHGGKVTRTGYFYWIFTDGATVGRKKRN